MKSEGIPFAGEMKVPENDCEEVFFQRFPDFFYEGSTALTLWTMAWQAAQDHAESKKPVIQLIQTWDEPYPQALSHAFLGLV